MKIKSILISALLCISCSTTINKSSGIVQTWDGKKYSFQNENVIVKSDRIIIQKEIEIPKKDVKIIYII